MSLKVSKCSDRPSKTPELRALACRNPGADQRLAARMRRAFGEVLKLLRRADLPALLAKFRKTPPVKNMSAEAAKKATAATSETIDEEAMRSYEKALKSGIQLQEESVNLWKDLLTKLGSPEEFQAKLESMTADAFPKARQQTVPDGAAYLTRTFACEAGSRDYKLYVPSHMDGRKLPLIICGTYITDGKVCPPFSFIG